MTTERNLRYLAVSGLCMVTNISVIVGLTAAGCNYVVASVIAFALVCMLGFALHAGWTFRSAATPAGFARYVAAMALNLPISILLIWLAHDVAGLTVAISATLATIALVVWNYLASRWAIAKVGDNSQ